MMVQRSVCRQCLAVKSEERMLQNKTNDEDHILLVHLTGRHSKLSDKKKRREGNEPQPFFLSDR